MFANQYNYSDELIDSWKYICQLRNQLRKNKSSLIIGAGVSWDLKLPLWDVLIDNIKNEISIKNPAAKNVNDAPGKAALVLFEIYQSYKRSEIRKEYKFESENLVDKKILADWRELIHKILYRDISVENRESILKSHPYFMGMIEFIKRSEITINYNFDDFVEFGISLLNKDSNTRPYQTIWSHHSQFTKDNCVIYHPNGFLPFDGNKFQSENLIFSDGAFADQLLEGIGGGLSTLLHVLTKKTSILLGHSLTDSTLLHLLRKASTISPGNYNYFIRFLKDEEILDESSKMAIFESNFNNYNLITLFFKNSDIKNFLKLLTIDDDNFLAISDFYGLETRFCYYLVGTVGSGKSTILSKFGNLTTLDEWFDERPPKMSSTHKELHTGEEINIDDWTNQQFGKKNKYLLSKKIGIFLVDRCPLDPLTFTTRKSFSDRAKSMLEKGIRPNKSKNRIVNGQIIHLVGNIDELWSRLITKRKEKKWPKSDVLQVQDKSLSLYESLNPANVNTTNRNENEVIRDVAKIIFSKKYLPSDIDGKMVDLSKNEKTNLSSSAII